MNSSKVSKSKRFCLLCGGKRREILYQEKRLLKEKITPKEVLCTGERGTPGRHAKIWQCLSCGLIFQDPSFSEDELEKAYLNGGEDERYFGEFKQRKNLFRRSLDQIEKYKKVRGKLLDVGSGAGLFVWVAKESGWEASGLEPSSWAVNKAKRHFGVKVERGLFENFKAEPESFEMITMWDVLEHFINPLEALLKARELLRKDGLLALTTINIESWFSRLLGVHWPWLIRVHLWYFTPETLTRLLEKAGLKVVWMGGQVRFFSLPYLLNRFTGRNFSWLPKIVLPAPTGDIIFVIAKKK